EDANAFVLSLDPARTWFRYHHLFGDLLRLELRRTLPDQVPALHRRAAGWLRGHGQVADAIRHTQAAGDWSDAARLLADHSFSLTLDGYAQTAQALVRAFELKVLRYLPMNLSRPEIAAELSVSVNTVSTHIRSIYAKLQVGDRSSAVQRARELRLLATAR
ncbi:MAG TPA: LuxR C-terminal-related transcriptional regulator, partial [Trebonia sp.]|nr:LuxR C-terminal-related transcriptional regulator [Trebonia sp.]